MTSEKLIRRVRRYSLSEAPGHLLRRCQQRAIDLFVEEVGEDGPTPRQFAILLSVFQNRGVSQTDLVHATGIDRSTLADILRRLADRGQVARARTEKDQRANAVEITAEGEAVLFSAFEAMERAQARILESVDPDDRTQAMAVLARLAGDGRPPSGAASARS